MVHELTVSLPIILREVGLDERDLCCCMFLHFTFLGTFGIGGVECQKKRRGVGSHLEKMKLERQRVFN